MLVSQKTRYPSKIRYGNIESEFLEAPLNLSIKDLLDGFTRRARRRQEAQRTQSDFRALLKIDISRPCGLFFPLASLDAVSGISFSIPDLHLALPEEKTDRMERESEFLEMPFKKFGKFRAFS